MNTTEPTTEQLKAERDAALAQVAYEQERNANNVAQYTEQLNTALAQVAEMRSDMTLWMHGHLENRSHREPEKTWNNTHPSGWCVVEIPDWEIRQKLDDLQSPDCGKGWKSPEEYAALEARVAEMRNKIVEFVDHNDPHADLLTRMLRLRDFATQADCGKGWVPLERVKPLADVLHWLNIQGGLGYEKHGRIDEALAHWEKVSKS